MESCLHPNMAEKAKFRGFRRIWEFLPTLRGVMILPTSQPRFLAWLPRWQLHVIIILLSGQKRKRGFEDFWRILYASLSWLDIGYKFELKLRRRKQRFGKIDTTVVLDKDEIASIFAYVKCIVRYCCSRGNETLRQYRWIIRDSHL